MRDPAAAGRELTTGPSRDRRPAARTARGFRFALAALTAAALVPRPLGAHDGPPYPVLVDQRAGPYRVSVWGDPDVGTGTFFITLETPRGVRFVHPTAVRVTVAPISGRLPEAVYDAWPERIRRGARYIAAVAFDRAGWWQLRVTIDGPAGGGVLEARVEATPAGTIGPIGLVVYAFPFIFVAFLLWRAARVRARQAENR